MPTYSYQCSDPECSHVTEVFCAVKDYQSKADCEACGKKASRQFRPVGIQTDSTFFAGVGTLLDQHDGDVGETKKLVKAAQSQGYTPGASDYYLPSIAQQPGDPAAFVPASGGRGHVRRVCEERGISCSGAVNYKAPQGPPRPKKKLADRVVRRLMKREIRRDPSLARKPKRELREMIVDRHAPRE